MSAMNPSTPPRNTPSTGKCPGAPRASRNRGRCPKTVKRILFPPLLLGTPKKRPSNEECPGAPSKVKRQSSPTGPFSPEIHFP